MAESSCYLSVAWRPSDWQQSPRHGAAASAQKNFDQFVGSDGKLDLQEFGLMFKNAGQGGAVSQEQVVKLFEAFDRSGDGEVCTTATAQFGAIL